MKKIDVADNVMKNVARFEKSRSQMWLRRFYAAVVLMLIIAGVYLWMSWKTISDLQGWDLLSIFMQDKEIIRDYWQDTVMTFIEELPIETLLTALVMLVSLIVIVYITRKRRKIYEYRMRELAKSGGLGKNNR